MLNIIFTTYIITVSVLAIGIIFVNLKRFGKTCLEDHSHTDHYKSIVLDLLRERAKYENRLSIEEYLLLQIQNRINWKALSANEDAIELLKDRIEYEKNTPEYVKICNENRVDWPALSLLRNANDILKDRIEYERCLCDEEEYDNRIDWAYLSGNQYAVELLEANPEKIDWGTLSQNKCAIELLKANPEKIVWENLSYNEYAIDLLRDNIDKIVWYKDYYHYLFEELFYNNLSKFTELFIQKIEYEKNVTDEEYIKIDWEVLCYTQNVFDILTSYPENILWKYLSRNEDPAIIELLRQRFEYEKQLSREEYEKLDDIVKIDWLNLSKNKNAIELLRDRVLYENSLGKEEYDSLGDNKVYWEYLSDTEYGIELLKENPDKIIWKYLSANKYAIKLLSERVEYESKSYDKGNIGNIGEDKIDWVFISLNRNAIDLIENRLRYENALSEEEYLKLGINKIDWTYLSRNKNPQAIELFAKKLEYEMQLSKEEYIQLIRTGDLLAWDYISKNVSYANHVSYASHEYDNQKFIDLLRKRIEYEKQLSSEEYDMLGNNVIDWKYLSLNSKNKHAIELLREYPEKVDWKELSMNQYAVELLQENPEKIAWNRIHILFGQI
jgi:hypothetical protein